MTPRTLLLLLLTLTAAALAVGATASSSEAPTKGPAFPLWKTFTAEHTVNSGQPSQFGSIQRAHFGGSGAPGKNDNVTWAWGEESNGQSTVCFFNANSTYPKYDEAIRCDSDSKTNAFSCVPRAARACYDLPWVYWFGGGQWDITTTPCGTGSCTNYYSAFEGCHWNGYTKLNFTIGPLNTPMYASNTVATTIGFHCKFDSYAFTVDGFSDKDWEVSPACDSLEQRGVSANSFFEDPTAVIEACYTEAKKQLAL
jgi:hypothetical protein